jgi:hypothetical protein
LEDSVTTADGANADGAIAIGVIAVKEEMDASVGSNGNTFHDA